MSFGNQGWRHKHTCALATPLFLVQHFLEKSLQLLTQVLLKAEEKKLSNDITNQLPKVIYSNQQSMLLLIDGDPQLKKNEDWGLDVVINSPFTIVNNRDGKFYLYSGGHWYVSPSAIGPYAYTKDKVQQRLKKIARKLCGHPYAKLLRPSVRTLVYLEGAERQQPVAIRASDKLPADFSNIPEGSPKDNVLASVAGTSAAKEAVMDA